MKKTVVLLLAISTLTPAHAMLRPSKIMRLVGAVTGKTVLNTTALRTSCCTNKDTLQKHNEQTIKTFFEQLNSLAQTAKQIDALNPELLKKTINTAYNNDSRPLSNLEHVVGTMRFITTLRHFMNFENDCPGEFKALQGHFVGLADWMEIAKKDQFMDMCNEIEALEVLVNHGPTEN